MPTEHGAELPLPSETGNLQCNVTAEDVITKYHFQAQAKSFPLQRHLIFKTMLGSSYHFFKDNEAEGQRNAKPADSRPGILSANAIILPLQFTAHFRLISSNSLLNAGNITTSMDNTLCQEQCHTLHPLSGHLLNAILIQ